MGGRIYPHMVLLIFANTIFKVSCKGNGSLTFVIDETQSMNRDIDQVISSVDQIADLVRHEKSSLIDDMVLVTFNDPGVYDRLVTRDPKEFKEALKRIDPRNEQSRPDCWEPSMKGLRLALHKSNNNSYIFVFTDAPAKDYIDSHYVIEMCQQKQTQIVFVITGKFCKTKNYVPESRGCYFDIAVACSGLTIFVTKEEVKKVFGPIKEIIKGNKTVITTATVLAGFPQNISFTVDDHTDYVIISASGLYVTLEIDGPSVSVKEIMSTANAKVLKLSNTKPGIYVATVKGKTNTSVIVLGRTDFFFTHGFSELKPKSLSETSPQPISDAKGYLAIFVTDDNHSVRIETATMLDMDGKPIIEKLPLREKSQNFYITDPFVAPSQRFRVAVEGIVKASNKPIRRTAKIPVTPPPPKIVPKVEGITALNVMKGETAVLQCKVVKGFPAPKLTWLFWDASVAKFTLLPGSESVLSLTNVEVKQAGKYKCVAENRAGKDELVTTLFVLDLPKIISRDTIYESTEGDASLKIPCLASGLPKPSITWKLKDLVIYPSARYSIEDGTLIISNPMVSDTDSYTCVATNEVGVVSATFKTDIKQAPQVSGDTDKKVRIGTSASIKCKVIKGVPKPTISWQFMDNSDSNSEILGSDEVLHIPSVENYHAGRYKCIAKNKVGSSEHITTLVVHDLPKIITRDTIIYESTEGHASLKIPCQASGLPKPSITWKLKDLVIYPSARYSIEDGTLIISNPMVSDTDSYTCVATNEVGVVSATFKTDIKQAPQVSGDTDKKVRIGTSASIKCKVIKGVPKPIISWQFMDNSDSNSEILGSDEVLHIPSVENYHAGRYKCLAKNKVGSSEHITTLVVQDLPKIISRDTIIYDSTEGDVSLKIPCQASGLPKPSITWKLKDLVIYPSARYSIEDGTLIISNPMVSDTDSYTCVATNEVGVVSATFKTDIKQAPQVSGDTDKKVRIGTSASIKCKVIKGVPKPTISWQFMDNSDSNSEILGSDEVLHIPSVENYHAGRYKCIAKNKVGSSEHITTLVVQDLPKIITRDTIIYESTEGDASLKIPCQASGLPKPSITWKLKDLVIYPSARYSIEDGTLIISNPMVSDTDSYTCVATNDVGVVSATFKTDIKQAPQVSGDTDKKVRIGTSASIKCKVIKGVPKPTISWQFMDNSDSNSEILGSDEVLHIPSVENYHAGRYKCIAKNKVGSSEHITTLVVQDLPKIISRDTIYESTEGDASLKIPCQASGLPKPSITWKLKDLVIYPSARYSIEDGTLIISNPMVSDTDSYTCVATNDVGVVSATFKTDIKQAPQVSGDTDKKVRIGTSASIKCKVIKGVPKPTISWQFMDNSDSNSEILGSDEVLHIPSVENYHAGRYKCIAKNKVGSSEHITTLVVQEAPEISGDTDKKVRIGTSATIECKVVKGKPKPTISWQFMDNSNSDFSIHGSDEVLHISRVENKHAGRYKCVAKNEAGSSEHITRLVVQEAPQVGGVAAKSVRMGLPTSIECTVKGEPKPTIRWQFMDNTNSRILTVPGSDKVLHISKVENKHAGRYKCVAKNVVGSDEHVTTLIVESLPRITTTITKVEGIEGDLALRIPCDVVGVPRPVVTWKINGTKLTTDDKYSIEDGALIIVKPEISDSSSYTCEAKNSVGSVNTTFQAEVEEHPKTFGTKHYVYLLQGETRKLKCEAYSSESQSVKWFGAKPNSRHSGSSLSTSSSQALETTTASNQDYYSSTTPPTITLKADIIEPYLQIKNASYSDDGSYMCRVTDKHGNTHTQTYVVDVGSAPKFHSEDSNAKFLSNWGGIISHIIENCDIQENAHPNPVVEWTFNGQVLTDFNSAGVGHYTCNVSNVHGSIQKIFNVRSSVCLITRNLKDAHYMPLVLSDNGFWHTFKTTDDFILIMRKKKITLSCPSHKETSNTFKNFPKKSTLEARCIKEDSFVVADKIYKLSDLQCNNSFQPSVIRKKVKCSKETSELIRVGYNVSGFLEAYEVCFGTEQNMPLHTRTIMTETNNNGLSAGYNWHTYPGIGNKKTERGFTCQDKLSSCCYSKSQLVNAIDFNDGPAMQSTFIDPLNVVPVWLPCNTSKPTWKTVNDRVTLLLPTYSEVITWSGTHTFQEKNGVIIPRYLWKLVWYDDTEVVAIVHVNDPSPTEKDIKCKDSRIRTAYTEWIHFNDKYTYCCSPSEFFDAFNIHIDIGEYLEPALDEIKNKI